MGKPVPIDDTKFEQMVLKADKPVLVDFWAGWCKPCLMVAPILDELAEEYNARINFVKMDVDQNAKTAAKYGIMMLLDKQKNNKFEGSIVEWLINLESG